MKKRWMPFAALILTLCLLLSSCSASGLLQPALFRTIGDSVSGFFGNAKNLLSGNKPLFLEHTLRYDLITDGSCNDRIAALADTIRIKTGVDITKEADSLPQKLRIGLNYKDDITASNFFVGFSGEDFIITARNDIMLNAAIDYFEHTYVTGSKANLDRGALFLPEELAYYAPLHEIVNTEGEALFSIVYPEGADPRAFTAIGSLRDAIKRITGVNLNLNSDFLGGLGDPETPEILIGMTARTESQSLVDDLTQDSYYLGVTGNKIVINATNGYTLQKAVDRFVELFITDEHAAASTETRTLSLPSTLSYYHTEDMLLLSDNQKSEYALIYDSALESETVAAINEILAMFQWMTGAQILAYSDEERPEGENAKEILVGNTNRAVSALVGAGMKADDWSISVADDDLIVVAGGTNPMRFALQSLRYTLYSLANQQNTTTEGNHTMPLVVVPGDLKLSGEHTPDVPSVTGRITVGENAYMMYRENAVLSTFNDYLKLLKDCGYSVHVAAKKAGAVHSATYYNGAEILNITFAETDNMLRVVTDPTRESALHPTRAIPYRGRTDVEPLFIQMGGIYVTKDCGMSYVVRLCDGTFLIVDGGWDNTSIASDLMATLQQYNVLEGDPVVSWIFTHGHYDHTGAFVKFTDTYHDDIDLRSVMYTFPNQAQTMIHGGSTVNRVQNNFRNMIAEYRDNTTIYKLRTGQELQFPGCEIEMLFTFEDYTQPKQLTYFNDSSIVFRLTLSKNGEDAQTLMMLGDCSESTAPILVARYGSYLKSDAVQVAHHGYAGGTDALYNAIEAAVVFWPAPLDHPTTGVARFSNKNWSKVTRRMLSQEYAKVLYVSGLGTVVLDLTQLKDSTIVGIGMVAADAGI